MKTPKITGKTTRRAASPAEAPPTLPLFTIRGQRVILDADLAHIYGVPTFRFNEAIKRNLNRFPEDFAFQLTSAEFENLKTILPSADSGSSRGIANSSQSAMSVYVVRAFVRQRKQLLANATILQHLTEIDSTLLEHDQALRAIWTELQPRLNPPPLPPKRPIGFSSHKS